MPRPISRAQHLDADAADRVHRDGGEEHAAVAGARGAGRPRRERDDREAEHRLVQLRRLHRQRRRARSRGTRPATHLVVPRRAARREPHRPRQRADLAVVAAGQEAADAARARARCRAAPRTDRRTARAARSCSRHTMTTAPCRRGSPRTRSCPPSAGGRGRCRRSCSTASIDHRHHDARRHRGDVAPEHRARDDAAHRCGACARSRIIQNSVDEAGEADHREPARRDRRGDVMGSTRASQSTTIGSRLHLLLVGSCRAFLALFAARRLRARRRSVRPRTAPAARPT